MIGPPYHAVHLGPATAGHGRPVVQTAGLYGPSSLPAPWRRLDQPESVPESTTVPVPPECPPSATSPGLWAWWYPPLRSAPEPSIEV